MPLPAAQDRLIELGPKRFLDTLTAKALADIDEWQTEELLKPMAIGKVLLYSTGLERKHRPHTGVEHIDNVADAVAAAVAEHGDCAVAVIPEGPYVVPFFKATDAAD